MSSQFNPIDYAQQLQAAGVPAAQADVHARTLADALANCAATKADLHALEDRLIARMDAFEAKITARMDAFEAKITARMDAFEARVNLELERMRGEIRLLKWMVGINTAMLIALIVKTYFP
jgi:hypothetical protein